MLDWVLFWPNVAQGIPDSAHAVDENMQRLIDQKNKKYAIYMGYVLLANCSSSAPVRST